MSPHSEEQLIEAIASALVVRTGDVLNGFSLLGESPTLTVSHLTGVVDFSPQDQVVTVRTGTKIEALQQELAEQGQCIPHRWPKQLNLGDAEIGNLIDFNLPHALEGLCGSWRDWILGLRVVLANGTICVAGSHAVKNVAGYDVQKLFVGARGTLGIVSQVTLKTYPLEALPRCTSVDGPAIGTHLVYIHRTLPTRYEALLVEAGEKVIAADASTATIWAGLNPEENISRIPGDWVIRSGCGPKNLEFNDPTQIRLMKRAKEIFDPTNKLNPGEMGIF